MSRLLIDANLLCLLVAGSLGPTALAAHPRLRAFGYEDYSNLLAIMDRVGNPLLCPHVLAETSNLISYRQTPRHAANLRNSLAYFVERFDEHTLPAAKAVAQPEYAVLGITDSILLLLAGQTSRILLSVDLKLCLAAWQRKLQAINYNYIRDGAMTIDQIGQ